jgi:hypothetical protein
MFLEQEQDEDDSASLADALDVMEKRLPAEFKAADVTTLVNDRSNPHGTALRDYLFPDAQQNHIASPKSVGKLLTAHVDEPVKSGDCTLILRKKQDRHVGPKGALFFYIHSERD